MDSPFPFGFPLPTAFYLALYVLTLVVHVVFMNYVLAGTGYLFFAHIFSRGSRELHRTPAARVLADWMPFAVSAAITAGVAPLLFVQLLYKERFYTANLLLFHRWMAILPMLIAGFYLVYLLRTPRMAERAWWMRIGVGFAAFACFAFTAWSWTENHLLGMADGAWSGFYGSGAMIHASAELAPRLALWVCGAMPTMALTVAWQLRSSLVPGSPAWRIETRRLAIVALVGLLLALLCATWCAFMLDGVKRARLTGVLTWPYLLLAIVGVALQAAAWFARRRFDGGRWLWLASCGLGGTLVGTTVVREGFRLGAMDITKLYPRHAEAMKVGGFAVFAVFLVLNTGAMVWCFRLVRRKGSSARREFSPRGPAAGHRTGVRRLERERFYF